MVFYFIHIVIFNTLEYINCN